jgi:branched-chain amino acid transport system permease protein
MGFFAAEVVNGLVLASFLALVAGGLTLIFGVAGIVNFAHGDFVMIGGYFFYELYVYLHLPYLIAIALTVLATGAFGGIIYWLALRHLIARAWYAQLIATLALSILFENIAQEIWSPSARSIATPYTLQTALRVGQSVNVSVQDVFVLVGTAFSLAWLWFIIVRTRWGKAMRAVSQNREACAVTGIDVRLVALLAFGISTALCGLAACLVLPLQDVDPTVGLSFTTQAFVVVILGGMGSIRGAIIAAVVVGLVDSLAAGYISSAYTDAFGYAVMIAILLVHPTGLFGEQSRTRGWVAL